MSDTPQMEIEARLLVIGSQRENVLARVKKQREIAGLQLTPFRTVELQDEYFEFTGDLLTVRDCALRVRRETCADSDDLLLTFKGPNQGGDSHCMERLELESSWSEPALLRLCTELRSRQVDVPAEPSFHADPRLALGGLGLAPVQSRRTRRQSAILERDGVEVAECTLDHGQYQVGQVLVHHREIELEARGDTTANDVLAIAADLARAFPGELKPWGVSKTALGRALEGLEQEGAWIKPLESGELTAEGYAQVEQRLQRSAANASE